MKNINLKILVVLLLLILIILVGNKAFAKYVFETTQFLIIETNLDRTPPKLTTSYSTTQTTNGDVIVTIKGNEKLQDIEGWTISNDKLTLTKTFDTNITQDLDVYDLAGNKTTAKIDITNIDKVLPIVQCTAITNSNTNYSQYANSEKEINLTIKVTDNLEIKDVDLSKITIKVNTSTVNPNIEWTLQSNDSKERIYNLKLKNISGDGNLYVNFENGFVTDIATNNNQKTEVDTKIIIDNTSPIITYSQELVEQGKVKAFLNANEKVRQLNGWNISTDLKQLNKEFVSNVSYQLTITDLAGNSTNTTVNVSGATYISLIYASHNSNIGWSYGYGNYDIAGKESVLTDSTYKTEALAFNISGNVENDFVMGRAYIYHYWGAGVQGKCRDTGLIYSYGYNPSSTSWKTMNSSDLVTISGKKYFQFGRSRN